MADVYDKLVRDEIPAIIEADGETPVTHVADEEEYEQRLADKLDEEVQEFRENDRTNELADVLEVIRAICAHRGVSMDELDRRRQEKAEERGGFEEGIVLERVES